MTLKAQNMPLIVVFTIFLGGICWWLSRGDLSIDLFKGLNRLHNSAVFVGICTILALAISELFPRKAKLILVFWKFKNPESSRRAFSKIMHQDHRIDPAIISKKFGPLPTNPVDQSRLFYKIYKDRDEELSIKDAHKAFLLFRELSVIAIVSSLVGTLFCYILSGSALPATIYFLLTNLVIYMFMALAGQAAGTRFVANTLAVATIR